MPAGIGIEISEQPNLLTLRHEPVPQRERSNHFIMTTQFRTIDHPRRASAFRTRSTFLCSTAAMILMVAKIGNATKHSPAPEITYQATLISKDVESQYLALNESGHIAGVRSRNGGQSSFLYRDGAITELMWSGDIDPKLSGGYMLLPKTLGDNDEVVVVRSNDGAHPMMWANGKYREIGPLPTKIGDQRFSKIDLKNYVRVNPIGFTYSGQVLVDLVSTLIPDGGQRLGVFLWNNHTLTELMYHLQAYPQYPPRPLDFGPYAVSGHGDIVGMTGMGRGPISVPSNDDKSFVVIWSRGKGTVSSIPSRAIPVAMNNHDQWIGNTFGSTPEGSPYTHACRSSPKGDKVIELETPAKLPSAQRQEFLSSKAYGINDNGDVVGIAGGEAVLWRDGVGKVVDLNDLIPSGEGFHLKSARGINSRGQIIATTDGEDSGYGDAYLLTPVKH